MPDIVKRPYRSLVDFPKVYQLLLDTYAPDWHRGVPAPFFEYAQVSSWSDKSQTHRFALWEDGGRPVAFCFYEKKLGEAFFNLADGYDFLASEMLDHAEGRLRADDGALRLMLYNQSALMEEARRRGYEVVKERTEGVYDFSKGPLEHPLPEGFSFEEPGKFDMKRRIEALWRGFDHTDEPEDPTERGLHGHNAPHATPELDVVVKNPAGDYVCCAGMWWVPQNKLAYLEPLSTVPECRRLGLASAALSELYRRTVRLGATHMTGGVHPFYAALGYEGLIKLSVWERKGE